MDSRDVTVGLGRGVPRSHTNGVGRGSSMRRSPPTVAHAVSNTASTGFLMSKSEAEKNSESVGGGGDASTVQGRQGRQGKESKSKVQAERKTELASARSQPMERKHDAAAVEHFFLDDVFGRLNLADASIQALNGQWISLPTYLEWLRDTDLLRKFVKLLSSHKPLIAEKTILDVGCGLGIWSLLCAKLGASRVLAIDSTPFISVSKNLIAKNECADVVSFLPSVTAALKELSHSTENTEVALILSDWIGTGFFNGNLLSHILAARDKLQPTPRILLGHVKLFVCAISDDSHHIFNKRWKHAGQIDFRPLRRLDLTTPIYGDAIIPESICTTSGALHTYDLAGMKSTEIGFTEEFCVNALPVCGKEALPVTALVIWCEVRDEVDGDLFLSTHPSAPRNRYGPTTFCFPVPPVLSRKSQMNGRLTFIPPEPADPVFILEYAVNDGPVEELFYGITETPRVFHS
ncbi:putative Protein arginine N-methyltransferase 8 [Hypsibius exemplaris]|uniref:Protein arginine N-methyltransferase domain-containing protein n=1 Tax=Hypsibius exemplaris TaxID=2072580 RepID=A0A9X6NGY5_HYPEX|nr:putative Protein arginine N-methyltransferase 8 [Hypsibius exemplaris]